MRGGGAERMRGRRPGRRSLSSSLPLFLSCSLPLFLSSSLPLIRAFPGYMPILTSISFQFMDIQITTKKSEGVERLPQVSVPLAPVQDEEERTARRSAPSVRLPGFRPGKAPAAMVRKRFKEAIRQQVLENLVQEAFKEVIEREKLDVAAQPHVHDVKFDEAQPLTFELHLEVKP